MNWPVLIIFGIGAIALLIFLVRRNFKDEKDLENQLKNNYRKPKIEENDTDAATPLK